MKTIGLLGGMSWESSALYYRIINELVRDRLGGLHSADILMYSYDFARIADLQYAGRWNEAGTNLADVAVRLEKAGAGCLVICTNTMHMVADQVAHAVDIPLLHIADCTALHVLSRGIARVGLLGTIFTMEERFYSDRLERFGLDVLVPDRAGREAINRIIYDELCQGVVREASRQIYSEQIASLAGRGARGIILGCTEIGLLVQEPTTDLALFDTTAIHAAAAVDFALGCDGLLATETGPDAAVPPTTGWLAPEDQRSQ